MRHIIRILLIAVCVAAQAMAQQVTQPRTITAVIASGASVSTLVVLGGCTPAAILMPSAWTAANVGIQATVDNATYYDVFDQYGSKLGIVAAASRWIVLTPSDTWSFFSLRLTSIDSAGTAVNQAAARTMTVVCR